MFANSSKMEKKEEYCQMLTSLAEWYNVLKEFRHCISLCVTSQGTLQSWSWILKVEKNLECKKWRHLQNQKCWLIRIVFHSLVIVTDACDVPGVGSLILLVLLMRSVGSHSSHPFLTHTCFLFSTCLSSHYDPGLLLHHFHFQAG